MRMHIIAMAAFSSIFGAMSMNPTIAYQPFGTDTSNSFDLKPIYQPRPEIQRAYPSLGLQLGQPSIKMLKQHVLNVVYKTDESKLSEKIQECVEMFNKSKDFEFKIDCVGEGVFKRKKYMAAIFFCCLKGYSQAAVTDKSFIPKQTLSPLVELFNLPMSGLDHPLVEALKKIKGTDFSHRGALATLLYSKKQQDLCNINDYVLKPQWEEAFLYKVSKFVFKLGVVDVLDAIMILNKARVEGKMKQETNLGYYVLSDAGTVLLASTNEKKRKVSLACYLIEKYERDRGAKKTPTENDLICCSIVENMPYFSFPSEFDEKLLSEKNIAFEEYNRLLKDIEIIRKSSDDDVLKCVKFLYPLTNNKS